MSPSTRATLKFIGIISVPIVAGFLIFLAIKEILTPLTALVVVVGVPIGIALTIVGLANTGQPYVAWNAKDRQSEESEKDEP